MRQRMGLLGALLLAWALATPGVAHADLATPKGADGETGGGSTPDGYSAYAVRLSGDYSVGLAARVPRPAPRCWWRELTETDPHDAEATYTWFGRHLQTYGPSSAGGGAFVSASAQYPQAFEDAIEADKVGDGITWHKLEWQSGMLPEEIVPECTRWAVQSTNPMVGDVPLVYAYHPFRTPPEPVVDVRVLAEYAYSVMNLVRPELDWNPKMTDNDNAALVNLPTWMWVQDREAVDTRSVTASVGDVSVTVTAQPGTVRVRSEAGSTVCNPTQARTSYWPGRDESSACTVSFSKESHQVSGGFAVTATVPWTASWTAGGESEGLDPRSVSETTYIPVSGSQALVTQVN